MRRVADMRAIDRREQQLLMQAGSAPVPSFLQEGPPVWVLMVHLGEGKLSEKLLGKCLKIVVKYGERGWSLQRETRETWSMHAKDGQGLVTFNETCVFLLRRGLARLLRLRLVKCGRRSRAVAKQDIMLNLDRSMPYYQEGLWKMIGFAGEQVRSLGSLRIVVEVRPFTLDDLCCHGINVGRVVPKVQLGDVADPRRPDLPLLQGSAVMPSPEAVIARQQAQERAQQLRNETPIRGDTDSEPETADQVMVREDNADSTTTVSNEPSSDTGNSEEEQNVRRIRGRFSLCC